MLKTTLTVRIASGKGRKRVFWTPLQSSETSESSCGSATPESIGAWLSQSQADSHASRSPSPADSEAKPTNATSGPRRLRCCGRYDRATRSWRTYPAFSLPGIGEPSCPTWPRWGTACDGECLVLDTSWLRIAATASGSGANWPTLSECARNGSPLYPTPDASATTGYNQSASHGASKRPTLGGMASKQLWPTPQARADSRAEGGAASRDTHQVNLHHAVKNAQWPTPTKADSEGGHRCRGGDRKGELLLSGTAIAANRGTWPTPRAAERCDYQYDRGNHDKPRFTLQGAVKASLAFPTPVAADGRSGKTRHDYGNSRPLREFVLSDVENRKPFPTPTSSMITVQDQEQARFSGNGGQRPKYKAAFPTPTTPGPNASGRMDEWGGARVRGMFATPKSTPSGPDYARAEREGSGGDDLATQAARLSSEDDCSTLLNPTWVEMLMGWPLGWTDAAVQGEMPWPAVDGIWPVIGPQPSHEPPRTADGVPDRIARLRAIGNGQVPHCAALAWTLLR